MHRYTIKQSTKLGSRTLLLTLQPKRLRSKLQFFPGQYAALGFKQGGRPSPVRCFSIVSTPNGDELQFALRVQGNFTKALARLEEGTEIFVYGPFGDFVIDEYQDKDIIMLAAGIGVTPFMSMIRNATEINLPIPLTLLYSSRSQEDIPFYANIAHYERVNPRFRTAFFVTQGSANKLTGSRVVAGHIDANRLAQVTGGNFNRFTYFVCGPKGFTKAMRSILLAQGTEASRILTEEFTPTAPPGMTVEPERHGVQWWTYTLTGASIALAALFFMSLDLVRLVPQALAASNNATPITTNSSGSSTSLDTSNAGPQMPDSAQPSPAPAYNYRYTPPMSSVS